MEQTSPNSVPAEPKKPEVGPVTNKMAENTNELLAQPKTETRPPERGSGFAPIESPKPAASPILTSTAPNPTGVRLETRQPERKPEATKKEEAQGSGWRKVFWAGAVVVVVLGLAANQWQAKNDTDQSAQVSGGFWSNIFGGRDEEAEETVVTPEVKTDLSFVRNADYVSPMDRTALYSVRDGQYRTEETEFAPDQSLVARGDLTGDGKEDAAVIVNEKTDGHDFVMLAIMENTESGYKNVRTVFLGDKIEVASLEIKGGVARIDVVSHHVDDLISKPTSLQTLIVGYDDEKGWVMNYE
ncbi:MAG: hypothetical protein V1856_00545 [Candidatus Liptonbacteria bacterium]